VHGRNMSFQNLNDVLWVEVFFWGRVGAKLANLPMCNVHHIDKYRVQAQSDAFIGQIGTRTNVFFRIAS
jgi:hypothetical protein